MINSNIFFNNTHLCLLLILVLVISSCSKSDEDPKPLKPVTTVDLSIDPSITYQTIAGFGGANQMWGTQFPNASDMKSAFGMDASDLGLSIFRIRIASNPDEWPLIVDVAKEAQKYGAKILASPWSPPPSLKSNGSDIGGHLLEENYGTFVEYINSFIDYMSSNGVEIYAISIQNEPDWKATYESCDWTAPQMRDFLNAHGADINGSVNVAAPESLNFNQAFTNLLLEQAADNFDIVAGHLYGGGLAPFPLAEQKGKEIWMTEYLLNLNSGNNPGNWTATTSPEVIWDESMEMLSTIHEAMMYDWNAYIWWYLKRYYSFIGDGTQGTTSGEVLKRGLAFSHYSKFIRPGYVRIEAELSNPKVMVTAYKGDGKIVVVLVNPTETPIDNLSISVSGAIPSSATTYSTTLLMDRDESQVHSKDGKLLINLLGKSVTTVVIEDK